MNNGQTFEALVAEFYQALLAENSTSQITTQERIAGPDGLREFDIVIRTSVADFESITLVECKDYGRLVSVETIDAFASKLADFSGNKGILISRKGFSKNAIQKAKRCGIDVCTIDKAKDLSTISEYNLPVFFRQIDF